MELPPRDVLEVLDPDRPLAAALYGANRARMSVIGLGEGRLLILSPGLPRDPALFEAVEALGRPAFLLAPNHFHNGGLKAWAERYPEATLVAHPRALPRLRKQVKGLSFEDLSALEAALPEGISLMTPPGAKQGEVWVRARTAEGAAWFVGDAIVNETQLPSGLLGILMKVGGFRERLMINPFFKRFFLEDVNAHGAWVCAQLEGDRPTLFIPCHGAVLRGDDVQARLKAAAEER